MIDLVYISDYDSFSDYAIALEDYLSWIEEEEGREWIAKDIEEFEKLRRESAQEYLYVSRLDSV